MAQEVGGNYEGEQQAEELSPSTEFRIPLSIYRVKNSIENKLLDPIKQEKLEELNESGNKLVTIIDVNGDDFQGKLYKCQSKHSQPGWIRFLQSGISDFGTLEETVTNGALLLLNINGIGYALTFGTGRFLLKTDFLEDKFGLKFALNCCYPKSKINDDYERIKSIQSKTLAANTIKTWKQSSSYSIFEVFNVDIHHDQLQSITGMPIIDQNWGRCLSGASSLRLNIPISFEILKGKLKEIEEVYQRTDYKEKFSWIDNYEIIYDQSLVDKLETILLNKFVGEEIDDIYLSPPEMIDWENFNECYYSSLDSSQRFSDIEFSDYYSLFSSKIDLPKLKKADFLKAIVGHSLVLMDSSNQKINSWPILRCLSSEFIVDKETYILNNGNYFRISRDFIDELDKFIKHLISTDIKLPDTKEKTNEGDYNKDTAINNNRLILLDKETVRIQSKTSPIEICDLFSDDRKMIHVKRKLSSSSLSHLFNQGSVSGELLLTSSEYRNAVINKLIQVEQKSGNPNNIGHYSKLISPSSIRPNEFEIVYAIIANWKGRELFKALPFFSKIALRRTVIYLRQLGFNVTYCCININKNLYSSQVKKSSRGKSTN